MPLASRARVYADVNSHRSHIQDNCHQRRLLRAIFDFPILLVGDDDNCIIIYNKGTPIGRPQLYIHILKELETCRPREYWDYEAHVVEWGNQVRQKVWEEFIHFADCHLLFTLPDVKVKFYGTYDFLRCSFSFCKIHCSIEN